MENRDSGSNGRATMEVMAIEAAATTIKGRTKVGANRAKGQLAMLGLRVCNRHVKNK